MSNATLLPPVDEPKLCISRRELARRTGLSERTLFSMTADGELPHIKLGRRVLYPIRAVEEWIKRQTHDPAGPVRVNG